MPSNHLIICHPLFLLPSIFPSIFSQQSFPRSQYFTSGDQSIGVSASASVLRKDWLDRLAVQGTSKSLLQHHSSKASILWHSAFFMVQLTSIHDYWKNHSLTRWTSVGKGMSLLFNMVSRLVTAFLPRSKRLLISWLQSLSVLISESKKRKSVTVSLVSPSTCHEMMEPDSYLLVTCFFLIKVLNLSGFRPEVVFLNKTKIKLCLLALYPVLFGKA